VVAGERRLCADIVSVGKILVDYKMPKIPGQRVVRMQMSSVANVLAHLKTNKAKLVAKPAALLKLAA
jgi:hypothetical protein